MSFAGLLGAGLLGGVANAAKGVGDKIREDAKQKRAMALEDRADARAEIANENAVEAAKQRRIFDAREGRLDRNQQTNIQDDAQEFTGDQNDKTRTQQTTLQDDAQDFTGDQNDKTRTQQTTLQDDAQDFTGDQNDKTRTQQTDLQNDQQDFTSGENVKERALKLELQRTKYKAELLKIKAAKVGDIKDFYDETTGLIQPHERMVDGSWEPRGGTKAPDASSSKGLTLQVAYNAEGEEVKGYMDGTTFVQVGSAKAIKTTDPTEARNYFTGQAKFILGGSQTSFTATQLTDDDTSLMRDWIAEAEAAFADNPKVSLSQIVKNIMFKPWVLDDLDITDADITAGENAASTAGANALEPIEYARQIATRKQPDFVNAQTAYNNIKAKNGNTDALFKRMRKMGYNPDYLIK